MTDNTTVAFERKLLCISQYTSGADFPNASTFSIGVAELLTVDSCTRLL